MKKKLSNLKLKNPKEYWKIQNKIQILKSKGLMLI